MGEFYKMKKMIFILTLLVVVSVTAFSAQVLYKGSGIVITDEDIKSYLKLNLGATPTPYALEIFGLLAELANKDYENVKGIKCPELDAGNSSKDMSAEKYKYYRYICYVRNYTDHYELSKDSVESFYYANWKAFADNETLKPLDKDLYGELRKKILEQRILLLEDELRESLMKKYQLKNCRIEKCE